jgi:hypothetical protein
VVDVAEIWRAADKVVFSTTVESVLRARTRIEDMLDPGAIQRMKSSAEGGRAFPEPS